MMAPPGVSWHSGPLHAPLVQEYWHTVPLVHMGGLPVQVCTVFPEHCAGEPDTQLPWHDAVVPLCVHVAGRLVQFCPATVKLPLASHEVTVFDTHEDWPGAHDPEQAPPTQVLLLHAAPTVHEPVPLHVSGALPEHPVWPGAHEPWQTPFTQVWLLHAAPAVHVPVALHVWGWLSPEQLVCPGAQLPAQAPLTQVLLSGVQAVASVHVPIAEQVCVLLLAALQLT
jgi:hypothetical protein